MNDIEKQLFHQLNEVEERKNWIHEEVMASLNLDRNTYLEVFSFSAKHLKNNILVEYIINERNKEVVEDFSVSVTYEEIISKKYALAAGQYFDVKIEYVEMTQEEFNEKMANYQAELIELFDASDKLQKEIIEQLNKVRYE